MKRVAIFTSACCTGFCYGYEADTATQAMIKEHAEKYNSTEEWQKRNEDGNVTIHDSVKAAIEAHTEAYGEEGVEVVEDLYDHYQDDGDGRTVNAAWIVHILLSDPMADDWPGIPR